MSRQYRQSSGSNDIADKKKFLGKFRREIKKIAYTGLAGLTLALGASGCADLAKYRNYAREQGSREVVENVEQAGNHLVGVGKGLVNVATGAYGTDNYKRLRENDGKNPLYQAKEAGKSLGKTFEDVGLTLYSLGDVVAFGLLPNPNDDYSNTPTLGRPFRYLGRGVCNLGESVENIANIPTLGLADNFTGTAYGTLKEGVEAVKNTGQVLTNAVIREPVRFVSRDTPEKTLDWICLVPFEYLSNVVELEGFNNMRDFEDVRKEKGDIFSFLEFLGSGWLTHEALDNNKGHHGGVGGGPGSTPPDPQGPFF